MTPTPDDYRAAAARLRQAGSIAVLSHVRPDGDAAGSLLGLCAMLEALAKQVFPVLADGLPERFAFLPGAGRVRRTLPPAADLTVAVDCSSPGRLGFPLEALPGELALNLDHHATNTHFATLNLVDVQAAATAEVLCALARHGGLPLPGEAATCLLAGLVSDTIGFRTANVTPAVLRLAADLAERGAPLAEVYDRALNRRSLAEVRFWGQGLAALHCENGLAWSALSVDDRRRSGYAGEDDADLINLLTTLEGAEIAIVFVEQDDGQIKVSWRSRAAHDVARLAQAFGGGGHEQAAGAMVEGDLAGVVAEVLAATRAFLHSAPETAG